MMKMKRLWSITLTLAMGLMVLSACSGGNAGQAQPPNESVQPSQEAQGGVLKMATNAYFPPYEFYENDKIVGIDAEVAAAIAQKLGMELQIMDMDFDSIIPAIQSGKADIGMAGMTITKDRLLNVSFTQTYATGVQSVIVPEGSPITSIDDLNGVKIGVQQGTTGDIYASDTPENGGFGEEAVVRFNKGTDAVLALTQGKVAAVIIDNEPAKAFVAANEGLVILETAYANEDYAIAMGKDNEQLLKQIDTALGELIEDGTVQAIIDKYITAD